MTTEIDLKMITYEGRKYGAGNCTVTLGNTQIPSVAVYAHPDKIILMKDGAAEWLVSHGLPGKKVEALFEEAEV